MSQDILHILYQMITNHGKAVTENARLCRGLLNDYCHGESPRGTDGREYPWGDRWAWKKCHFSVGIFLANSGQQTAPVGSYSGGASPYGVQDMAGNVFEWCDSWYDGSNTARVLRGCSGNRYDFRYFRAATRYGFDPAYGHYGCVGFRCVLRAPSSS